jgi:hypothetical protein
LPALAIPPVSWHMRRIGLKMVFARILFGDRASKCEVEHTSLLLQVITTVFRLTRGAQPLGHGAVSAYLTTRREDLTCELVAATNTPPLTIYDAVVTVNRSRLLSAPRSSRHIGRAIAHLARRSNARASQIWRVATGPNARPWERSPNHVGTGSDRPVKHQAAARCAGKAAAPSSPAGRSSWRRHRSPSRQ